jgi:hypothetical protein
MTSPTVISAKADTVNETPPKPFRLGCPLCLTTIPVVGFLMTRKGNEVYTLPCLLDNAATNARRAQPIPPALKCSLLPGNYSGRFSGGILELPLPGQRKDKYDSVRYKLTPVVMKQQQ